MGGRRRNKCVEKRGKRRTEKSLPVDALVPAVLLE